MTPAIVRNDRIRPQTQDLPEVYYTSEFPIGLAIASYCRECHGTFRNPLLYPAELRGQLRINWHFHYVSQLLI